MMMILLLLCIITLAVDEVALFQCTQWRSDTTAVRSVTVRGEVKSMRAPDSLTGFEGNHALHIC